MAHSGKAHIFQSVLTGEWYIRLIGDNGEPIMASEGHKNEKDVLDLCMKYFPLFELVREDV